MYLLCLCRLVGLLQICCACGFIARYTVLGNILYLGLARTLNIRCIYGIFWQGNHQIYGHIRCKHTVLANPDNTLFLYRQSCHVACFNSSLSCRQSWTQSFCPFVVSAGLFAPFNAPSLLVHTSTQAQVCKCIRPHRPRSLTNVHTHTPNVNTTYYICTHAHMHTRI